MMDKLLSPETQSQIRALCESIAQRDQLGEDVQEELRGHIEDKVVAYLDGKEALSEADALLLAREHLGREHFRFAATSSNLARTIAMLAAVTLVSGTMMGTACSIALLPFYFAIDQNHLWIASLVSLAVYYAGTCALMHVLLRLERRNGRHNVLCQLKQARAWQILVITFGLAVFTWSLWPGLVWEWHDPTATDAFTVRAYLIGRDIIRGCGAVFMCMLWMRRCAPRVSHMQVAAMAWAALLMAHFVVVKLVGSSAVVIAKQADPTNIPLFETPSGFHISMFVLSDTNVHFGNVIFVVTLTACFSYVLYSTARRLHQRVLNLG